jgi:hypothetical protein
MPSFLSVLEELCASSRYRNPRGFSKQNQRRMYDCKGWSCNCSCLLDCVAGRATERKSQMTFVMSQRSDRQGNTATVAKGSRCERCARGSRIPLSARLQVFPVPEVGWSDWGSVERTYSSLKQMGKLQEGMGRYTSGIGSRQVGEAYGLRYAKVKNACLLERLNE